jgi:hypothetical protein
MLKRNSKKTDLKDEVLKFQKTDAGLESIIQKAILQVWEYPILHRYFNEDDRSEIILEVYRRLPQAVRNFKDHGYGFNCYLNKIVHYSVRAVKRRNADNFLRIGYEFQHAVLSHPPNNQHMVEDAILCKENEAVFLRADFKLSRVRAKCILMKLGDDLSESWIRILKIKAGWNSFEYHSHMELQRKICERYRDRIAKLIGLRNTIWKRLNILQADKYLVDDIKKKKSLHLRNQLLMYKRRIASCRTHPSNREIAELLGISKGTVDSALYKLKYNYTIPDSLKNLLYGIAA